ncbi:transporter [Hyphomicrobium sp.]|uniref:ZIP family metal transporter n=1 Tax=Hyphomicrobium sp. TaxID=82 RepID=UPI000FA4F238|nr:transporter [Hyphomicrobium sp.]MBN9246814.1 transporter [Hyphomicrobium sp.]RUP07796.1 MAG: transporter [Hyphomicrobium sp.]
MALTSPLYYTVIPVIAAVLGAVAAVYLRPGPTMASAIQHFAAGVVFAAAAGEVLPDLKHSSSLWPIVIGGAAGIGTMLIFKELGERTSGQTGLAALVGLDLFIDGLVLGLGFAASAKAGLLLTVALTLEVLFLGLSLAAELSEVALSRFRRVGIVGGAALLLPAGAFAASGIARLSPATLSGFMAFALIALLYLVTEELLVDAHETPDRPWVTALFFIGFLLLLVLEQLLV